MQRRERIVLVSWIWRSIAITILGSLLYSSPGSAATPLPWQWVLDLQQRAQQGNCPLWDLRRSPLLASPSGRWQVYSRLELQVDPQSASDQLSSVLFARDQQTERLQVIHSVTPVDLDFALLVPVSWQQDRLLIREHAGVFQSDIALDQAVIWAPETEQIQVLQPPPVEITELLDWDPLSEQNVLFAIGQFGETPSIVSLGQDSDPIPRTFSIDTFPNSAFTPPSSEEPLIQWRPGLPQITGPLCGK